MKTIIAFLLLLLTLTVHAAPDQKAKAVFKSEVKKEDLSESWKKLNSEALIKKIEASPKVHPPVFRPILAVERRSQAEGLGVTAGCKVVLFPNEPDSEGKFHWIDLEGNYHASVVKPGLVGVDCKPIVNLVNWYVSQGKRNVKWDAMVVAALQSLGQDVRIADAMWAKALQLGYTPDHLSNLSGMAIAMHLGDIPRAEAFAEAYGPLEWAPKALLFPNAWHKLANLTANPKWWTNAAEGWEIALPGHEYCKSLREIAEVQTELAKQNEGKLTKSPSELADTMKRTSWLKREDRLIAAYWNIGTSDDLLNNSLAAAEKLPPEAKEFPELKDSIAMETYTKGWTGPKKPVRDVDVTITFKVNPLTAPDFAKSQYVRELCLGLVNGNSKDQRNYKGQFPNEAQALTIAINYNGYLQPEYCNVEAMLPGTTKTGRAILHDNPLKPEGHQPSRLMPDESLKRDEFHTLRLVRVGPQAEAILNGKRISLVYVHPRCDEMGLATFRSGIAMSIKSIKADILN